MKSIFLAVAIFTIAALCQHNCPNSEGIVDTEGGCVQGVVMDDIRWFKGIPFAEPPLGQNRWASPLPAAAWAPSTYQAVNEKPGCPQACVLPPSLCPTATDEDCLYLDVATPRLNGQSNPNWPVMVFIAGGAYEQGSAFVPVYNPEYISNTTNTVVVLISYRLGALGWLVTDNLSGNYGIQDQRLAFVWVQNNIANFGGDPTQVTIFGESAGAGSVGVHLMSEKTHGMFTKAIMESNPISLPFKTLSIAAEYGAKLASAVGCGADDTDCLRAVPYETIVGVEDSIFIIPDPFRTNLLDIALTWAPVIDGDEVNSQVVDAFTAGEYQTDVPFIIGTNSGEGVMFVYGMLAALLGNGPLSDFNYDLLIGAIFQADVFTVKAMYPCGEDDCRMTLSTLLTHYVFSCPSRKIAMSAQNYTTNGDVYLYSFNHSLSFDPWGANFSFCQDYACHGAELPFVFHSADKAGFQFSPAEELISEAMVTYWTNFAHNGDPNQGTNSGPVNWPLYTLPGTATNVEFTTPTVLQTYLDGPYCDMWDSLGYDF